VSPRSEFQFVSLDEGLGLLYALISAYLHFNVILHAESVQMTQDLEV
jgi:hypothetical protein